MSDLLFERVKKYRDVAISQDEQSGENTYLVVKNFRGTSFEGQDEGIETPIFRSFIPIKPESGREMRGDKFDMYKDTLFDYPNIISSRIQKPWEYANFLISVHVAACPLNCWHCYVDECLRIECNDCLYYQKENCKKKRGSVGVNVSANFILDCFIYEHNRDRNRKNVLRLTGGEPFLVPELLLELLRGIEERGLSEEVFVWTETNLLPFIAGQHGKRFFEEYSDVTMDELNEYHNWALHPCIHGASDTNFLEQTGVDAEFEKILDALFYLCEKGTDIYPTVSSNLCPNDRINELFDRLNERFANLPLRVALIEYDLRYQPVMEREISGTRAERPLFNKWMNIYTWNKNCIEKCGYRYAQIPREDVVINSVLLKGQMEAVSCKSLKTDKVIGYPKPGEFIYIFKSCYRPQYKQELLSVVSLPIGSTFQLDYREDLINESIIREADNNYVNLNNKDGILIYMDKEDPGNNRFIPLRRITIKRIIPGIGMISFIVELGEYTIAEESFPDALKAIIDEGRLPHPYESQQEWVFKAEALHQGAFRSGNSEVFLKDFIDNITLAEHNVPRKDWKDSCFVIIGNMKECYLSRKEDSILVLEEITSRSGYKEKGYLLKNNKNYYLPIKIYNPHYDQVSEATRKDSLIVDVSSGALDIFGKRALPVSKYTNDQYELRTNDVLIRKTRADIRICSGDESCNFLDVVVKVKIELNKWQLWVLLACLFIAACLFVAPTVFKTDGVIVTGCGVFGFFVAFFGIFYYTGRLILPR